MISIKGLHKFFNKGRHNEIHVINNVNLDLPERGMVAIFGKSGCGKTTLLNVIGGLDKFAEGTLTIEGKSIGEHTDVIRNQYIGYIFQNYNLNKGESCFDNVADALRLCGMSDEDEIEVRVRAALTNVGMEKYAKRTPDTLSGGQQQRIAIARAIVKNPRIILADEPTGNLDEANTVMIMDLLKAISKDHLVLLVTHEANLVDHYCDTVIELCDGKIVDTKQNTSANGFAARDKNDIYLGELDHRKITDESAEIEYYGEKPETPIRLKIVNNGGKIYLQIGTQKVQIIDEFSEIKLREGVYEEKLNANTVSEGIDMSKLPPVEGTRFGRLFTLRSSIKSGYVSNFKNRKKGKKLLRRCMSLFAAVIVFMSTVFGSAFGDILSARKAYNHNVFYLYTPNAKISAKVNDALGKEETGIDYIRLMGDYPYGDSEVYFRVGTFETFLQYDWQSNFKTNAVYLDLSLASELELVEGTRDGLSNADILISTKVADELLEKSTLGYITEREDLIGLVSNMFTVDGRNPRIAGIVKSDEPAIYLTELAMAKYVRGYANTSYTLLASDFGIEVAPGEAILAIKDQRADTKYPTVGETIKIQGRDIKVVEIKNFYGNYDQWRTANGVAKKDMYKFFYDMVRSERSDLVEGTQEFNDAVNSIMMSRYYEYYDYVYSEFDAFAKDYYFFQPDQFEIWLYLKKGIEAAKYIYLPEDYYKAVAYKEMYGSYPTKAQMDKQYDNLPYPREALDEARTMYEDEFFSGNHYSSFSFNSYMVSEKDYIAFSKQLGETHPSATEPKGDVSYGKYAEKVSYSADISYEGVDVMYMGNMYYTVIHSNDPEKTDAWLKSEFSGLSGPNEYFNALITPDSIFEQIIMDKTEDIVTSLITMVIVIVLMSLCMYFIMRSSLMNRIKEVGIYRAIGVSKKNLVFKFFIEAIVLTALTILVGFILTSGFIFVCLGMSSLVSEIFYYPVWLACADLIIICVISLFFGTLPILSLLRKTPSEILAKYDI